MNDWAGRSVVEGRQELGPPGSLMWTAPWLGNTFFAIHLRWAAWGVLGSSASQCTVSVPSCPSVWLLCDGSFHGFFLYTFARCFLNSNIFDFLLDFKVFSLLNFSSCNNYMPAFSLAVGISFYLLLLTSSLSLLPIRRGILSSPSFCSSRSALNLSVLTSWRDCSD